MLWNLLLAIIDTSWVFPKLVRETLHFCWEEMQESLDGSPSMHFLDYLASKK